MSFLASHYLLSFSWLELKGRERPWPICLSTIFPLRLPFFFQLNVSWEKWGTRAMGALRIGRGGISSTFSNLLEFTGFFGRGHYHQGKLGEMDRLVFFSVQSKFIRSRAALIIVKMGRCLCLVRSLMPSYDFNLGHVQDGNLFGSITKTSNYYGLFWYPVASVARESFRW